MDSNGNGNGNDNGSAARDMLSRVDIPADDNSLNGSNVVVPSSSVSVSGNGRQSDHCEYPMEFVDSIIKILSRCSKLSVFTIRVLSELLIDLVQDRTMRQNGLNDRHHAALSLVWGTVKSQVASSLPLESAAMETYFIDTFEEEWREVRKQPRIDTLVANPIRILPPHVLHGKATAKNQPSKPPPPPNKAMNDDNVPSPHSPSGTDSHPLQFEPKGGSIHNAL